ASLTPAYEQALDAYLSAYPSHDGAAEARYLLAELHRARGHCKRAEAEYGAVGTGPFAARARLGGPACRVLPLGQGSAGRTQAPALALARRVYAVLVRENGDAGNRIILADLDLRAGDAAGARALYEEVLKADAGSAEALRGAARAAAAQGDREHALAYWRSVLDASPPGGTAWYEARVAQVTLLAEDGQKAEACELLRAARGRATSAGGDQLEARLREMEPRVCQ